MGCRPRLRRWLRNTGSGSRFASSPAARRGRTPSGTGWRRCHRQPRSWPFRMRRGRARARRLLPPPFAAAQETGAAVAAQPVTDTIKESRDGQLIERTLDRSRLWAVQTPQTFRVQIIRRALSESAPPRPDGDRRYGSLRTDRPAGPTGAQPPAQSQSHPARRTCPGSRPCCAPSPPQGDVPQGQALPRITCCLAPPAPTSGFGFRTSFGVRTSDFGLRTSPAALANWPPRHYCLPERCLEQYETTSGFWRGRPGADR